MQTPTSIHNSRAKCPLHSAQLLQEEHAALTPSDLLLLPLHRRVLTQFATGDGGATELRLFYGDKEISFDDSAFFAFGQTLAQQSRFAAGAATAWGAGYGWTQVRPLLEELLQAGVLQRAASDEDMPHAGHAGHAMTGTRPAPLPPGPCQEPRMWTDAAGCEDLMRQLTGRPLELGWLEMVLPIFRVAHAALDSEGRQVGEANVFPQALRLDVTTNWRACIYAGTRYQVDRPMNVSALKAMRQHWGTMMVLLAQVRAAYLQRYPQCRSGWTVGQIERLACCVLALPTYLLMRGDAPLANGSLHPALSCLFRVTDGLRMVMHQMLFVPIGEPTLKPDAPMTSAEILAYAERNYSLHSEHGVCAGPQVMIEEFLAVLVDGAAVEAVAADPDIEQALASIEPAVDYALHGLRVHAAVFSLWPAMARSYEQLNDIAQGWSADLEAGGNVAVQRLGLQLQRRVAGMQHGTYVANEQWRADRMAVYADMYAQCGLGLLDQVDDESLIDQLAPMLSCRHARVDAQIEALLQRRLGRADGSDRARVRALRDALMHFFLQLQAVLRVACAAQAQLNGVLGREQPQRSFDSADLDITNLLQGSAERRLPYLIDELATLLQMRVRITADVIEITEIEPDALPAAAASLPNSTGMVPGEPRADRTPI